MDGDSRTVGDRGQITIPKVLRERFGIRGGDEVVVRGQEDRIVIEAPTLEERLAAGYRERADRDGAIDEEFAGASSEANRGLGEAPDW